MKPSSIGCGLEVTLAVVGGKWKPLVLWQLGQSPRRFGELRRAVVGISEKILAQVLRELEADGVVARQDFQEIPPRVEYSVTPLGVSLCQALKPLCEWGQKHTERIAHKTSHSAQLNKAGNPENNKTPNDSLTAETRLTEVEPEGGLRCLSDV